MSKYKIVALFGESGCGKDTIKKYLFLEKPDLFYPIVMSTTRPKRDYEKEDFDYHFLTPEEFTQKIFNGDILEAQMFNDWAYGLDANDLVEDKINIGAFSIDSIETILEQCPNIELIPIRIVVDDKTRLERAMNREENPNCEEICRRFLSDKKDFSFIDFKHWIIPNYTKPSAAATMIVNLLDSNNLLE